MAIVPLEKLTVYGASHQKAEVLNGLQELGCLHLVHLNEVTPERPQLVSKEAREALQYLETCPMQRRPAASTAGYDRRELIAEARRIKQRREELAAEQDLLEKAIEDLEPWGDFRLPSVEETGGQRFWFYVLPQNQLKELPDNAVWEVVRSEGRFTYLVLVAAEPPEELGAAPIDLDQRPLSELRQRLDKVESEFEDLQWKRVVCTRWIERLRNDLDAADDRAARTAAANGALDDGDVFVVQGWIPRSANAQLQRFGEQQQLAVTIQPPSGEDSPPTLLANPKAVAGAEDCVTFYMTPNYHTWDPTTIVFFSFSLFFAMIVSDAGYGLLLTAIVITLWRRLSETASGVRFRNLMLGIVSATIIYGVLAGSYFGFQPAEGTFLDSLRFRINGEPIVANNNAMMLLSVAIGVGHLSLANLISAWQSRWSPRCLGHLGWAAIMVGAFLMGGGKLLEIERLFDLGMRLIIPGAIGVLLFSSDQPLLTFSPMAHLRRLLDGVMQVANLSKAFGDSLSYLRLFALGLASAQLAVTFNGLAASAAEVGGLGVLLALLILVVGHGINFLLGLMGGVVHGLRLNCIEFFNWSLTQEGYAFESFRKKAES